MNDRRGFALLAALWLLVALSTVSLALGEAARARRLAAANASEGLRARAAAQAGIEVVRARLAQRLEPMRMDGLDPWRDVDSLGGDTMVVGSARYTAEVQDVGAALHLNRASEDELRRLLTALRVDAGLADRLAQRILDWRDADDLHRARGAEKPAYLEARALDLPRNGPFQALGELRSVLGMTPEVYERVRPHLTLLGSGQVNLGTAPRPVLLALPGMTEEAAAVIIRLRGRRPGLSGVAELGRELSTDARRAFEAALPTLLVRATTATREVEVTSHGWLPGGPVEVRITALFVRARDAVFYVWSRAE